MVEGGGAEVMLDGVSANARSAAIPRVNVLVGGECVRSGMGRRRGTHDREPRSRAQALQLCGFCIGYLTCIEEGRMTMWVDALVAAADRRRQAARIEVFNARRLRSRGCTVVIRLRERHVKKPY